jgi:hypothetical protein
VDAAGRAHVTGTTGSPDFPVTESGSSADGVFVTRFDPAGSQITYSTVLGGTLLETSGGIALDAERNAYVTGMTDSPEFPTTAGAYDTDHDGTSDGFVTKLLLQPRSTPGCKVSGGGRITAANGDRATFGGSARAASERDVSGNLDYVDQGPATHFRLRTLTIDALVCDGPRATIVGLARVDGSQVDFTIDLLDAGEPGRSDTYRLRLSSGYDSGTRTLDSGNVQVLSP